MLNNTTIANEDLSFTAFIDLCRFCSIRSGPRLNLFDKEAEDRQILFKIRTLLLPITVSTPRHPLYPHPALLSGSLSFIYERECESFNHLQPSRNREK